MRCILTSLILASISISSSALWRNDGQEKECTHSPQPVEITNSCDSLLRKFVHSQPDSIIRHHQLTTVFDTLVHSDRPLRVLHIGDSHVAGKSLPMAVKQYLGNAFGLAENDSVNSGISFSFIAKNGATALNFLTPERKESIRGKNADLVIMSFGTNECHGMGYREEEHLASLTAAVDTVRSLCPEATILLTTPPGDYLSHRTRYYIKGRDGKRYRRYRYNRKPNPMTTRCAALICRYAEEQDMPVWDLNTIVGGEMSVRNWQKQNMMRKDMIHFYPEGYAFQGRMFGEALVKAYNRYLVERTFIDESITIINKYVEY